MLRLQATAGPCEGTSYSKAGTVLTVGRTRASKVHIKDPAVSEKHAELRLEGGHWAVTDVGSSNGTAVNNKPLEEGKSSLILKLYDSEKCHTQEPMAFNRIHFSNCHNAAQGSLWC